MVIGNVMSVRPVEGTFVTLHSIPTRARIGHGASAARMALVPLILSNLSVTWRSVDLKQGRQVVDERAIRK